MFIQTQDTPNPETLKFIPGVEVLKSGTRNYLTQEAASSSPLAQALFKISEVRSVFLTTDFISVTKIEGQNWDYLKPMVLAAIMDHYLSGLPVVTSDAANTNKEILSTDSLTNQIIDMIEQRVRPAVAQDGGDIIFRDFRDGIVYLELHGACSGCPSSTVTLKSGIENMLKHYIPEVLAVEAV